MSSKPKQKKYCRDVVLLSRLNMKSVVRGSNKADLMRKGQVILCFEFCKDWTDKEMYENLIKIQDITLLLYLLPHFIDPFIVCDILCLSCSVCGQKCYTFFGRVLLYPVFAQVYMEGHFLTKYTHKCILLWKNCPSLCNLSI